MTIQIFGTMIIYMVVSSFTPGLGNILALNTMLAYGWNKGKELLLGIICGYATVQIVCTFAIFGLNKYLLSVLDVLKYAGTIYLVWLSVHIIISKPLQHEETDKPSFRTGYMMQLVNIKIYFYSITLLTAYIVPALPELWEMLIIGIFVVFVGSTASFTWAFLGLKMQKIYTEHFKTINSIFGLFLIYCAVNMIVS